MAAYKVDFEALPWQIPMEGVRCKAEKQGGRQLRLVEYTPDMPPHWCAKGHIGYVLEGHFEIRFEEQTQVYEPGDGIFIPPGGEHKHMGRALTEVVRVIFVEDA